MPRVPTYDQPQVTSNTLPQPFFSAAAIRPMHIDDTGQRQAAGLVAESQKAVAEANDRAYKVMADANQVRYDEAVNKALEARLRLTYDNEAGFTTQKGAAVMERNSGKPLSAEYSENYGKALQEISAGLGNDAQRRAFSAKSSELMMSFKTDVIRHEAQEFRTHKISVRTGTIDSRTRQIGLEWHNEASVNEAVQSINASAYDLAMMNGKSAIEATEIAKREASKGHVVAIESALNAGNVGFANNYMNKYRDQIDIGHLVTIDKALNQQIDFTKAQGAVQNAQEKLSQDFMPDDVTRLSSIVKTLESGGRRFDQSGKLLESPKGAKGEMQVLDSTNLNPGFGVRPAQDNTPDERARVGRDYLTAMLRRYGRVDQALAAYNAGPGAVDMAISKAKNPKNDTGGDWYSFLPNETKAYVEKGRGMFNQGAGNPARPTELQFIEAAVSELGPNARAEQIKVTTEAARRRYSDIASAIKQREDESVSTAMRGIMQNGGSYSDLPVGVRAAVPPKEVDNLIGFAQKISKGDDTTNLWLYNDITANPAKYASYSDDQFYALRKELSESDFKHFSQERAKQKGQNNGTNGPGDLNSGAIKQVLDSRLRMINIDPSPKDDGGADAARIGGIRRFVDQYLINSQSSAGKKFSDAEVAQRIDSLFATNVEFRGFFSNSSGPMLGMKIGDLDSETKDGLRAKFKKAGVSNPTDAQLLNAYWNMKVTRK